MFASNVTQPGTFTGSAAGWAKPGVASRPNKRSDNSIPGDRPPVISTLPFRLGHFDRINLAWSMNIGAKYTPFSVGCKSAIGLYLITVLGQVQELLRLDRPILRREEIKPL